MKSCGVTFHVVGEDERDERKISQLGGSGRREGLGRLVDDSW